MSIYFAPAPFIFVVNIIMMKLLPAYSSSLQSESYVTIDMTDLAVVAYVETEQTVTSPVTCASVCMMRETCDVFSFDSWSGRCRVDVILNRDSAPLSPIPNGVVFYEVSCPASKGYSVTTAGAARACLKVYLNTVAKAGAESTCSADGAHLYRLDSEQKKEIVKKHITDGGYPLWQYWLDGVRQQEGSSTFVLGNGGTISGASSIWCAGEPNVASHMCVHLRLDVPSCHGAGLNDVRCSYLCYIVCEVDV